MQSLRADTEAALKALIKGVHGVAVTFDLWMSKKTDDILSLDVHFVSEDWVWHHKHLGLVAMNGQTTGMMLPNYICHVCAMLLQLVYSEAAVSLTAVCCAGIQAW